MVYVRRNRPPLFPKMRIWNKTTNPVYVGIKTANAAGIWLAPKGDDGASIDLVGIDFTHENTVNALKRLVRTGVIGIHQVSGFYEAYSIPTTSPAPQ